MIEFKDYNIDDVLENDHEKTYRDTTTDRQQ